MDMRRARRRPRGARWSCTGLLLLAATGAGAKTLPTTCQDICDTLTATACTVSTIHDPVVPGSNINCTVARAITITGGGELRVHDGTFTLRGKSLTLDGGKLTADCPQLFDDIGFRVIVQEFVTFVANGGGKMSGRCDEGGGAITLEAGGAVTIAALGIDASGTSADAPGGTVEIEAGGPVTVQADIRAEATAGVAPGGRIAIRGDGSIDVQAFLVVKGYGGGELESPGGEIVLDAGGDVLVTAGGGLNAESAKGGGGEIEIEADGLIDLRRPLRLQGTGGSDGVGGAVTLTAAQVKLDNDVTVSGGRDGGTVFVEARGGGITVGTGSQATELDVRGNNGESGGTIVLRARGSHVALGANAIVHASGAGIGVRGGLVRLDGVNVTTAGGTKVYANGAAPDRGGAIEVQARGALTLDGIIQANNQGSLSFVHRDGTPTIGGGITGYELVALPTLTAPCGDGIRLTGVEQCDGGDLGDQTCSSRGLGSGILKCASDCTFDTSGCSGS